MNRTAPSGPMLEIIDVSKHYEGVQALERVSFVVRPGEIVALIGPNGAGKTTLLNIVSGITPPSSGQVRFGTRRLDGLKPYQVAALGIARTFQAVQIFPQMSVLENVLLGLHPRGASGFVAAMLHLPGERREESKLRRRAYQVLEQLDLAPVAHRRADTLPLRQQRLVEIARSVAAKPELILLDEPAAGLNLEETEEMEARIRRLRRQGTAVLLVEHDMNLVMPLADRVVVLHHGSKIADGPPAEVQKKDAVIHAYLGGTFGAAVQP